MPSVRRETDPIKKERFQKLKIEIRNEKCQQKHWKMKMKKISQKLVLKDKGRKVELERKEKKL